EESQKHLALFYWKNFAPDNEDLLKSEITKAAAAKKKIEDLENLIDELTKKQDNATNQTEKIKEYLIQKEKQKTAKTSEKETLLTHLKILEYGRYAQIEQTYLEKEKKDLAIKYETIISDFNQLTENSNRLNEEISQLKGQIFSEENNQEKLLRDTQSLTETINQRLKVNKLNSIEEVNKILAQNLDLEKEQNALKEYYEAVIKTQANLKSEQEKINSRIYHPEEHKKLVEEIEKLKAAITKNNESKGALEEIIKKLKLDFEAKQKLTVKLVKLKAREENITTLKKLFKGNGFVNFISTKYLQNLCHAANERFYKLTKQQLKLEITASNSFQVRDYLHEGKVRSIKTLSGGQTFQAAFCLALALADQVNLLVGAKQNFFFLDEGFGTLDSESLHMVFDSLKSLHKENRIVGVISHVEDMQQDIDVYLRVKNDVETGSFIERSWG
ncbi:MAG: SMC family ATPase, partial [Candidatus Margulisiibacteriota bacterium]